jgi:acetate kinase
MWERLRETGLVRVLVVNAGSSSVKLRVIEVDDTVGLSADLGPPSPDMADQLADFVERAGPVEVVGHRVVHGGDRFDAPTVIDDQVRFALGELSELAPLHLPPALAAIDAVRRLRPNLLSVACFDTAFHAQLPAAATVYALPAEWRERWKLRRYGFHGLSCTWATARVAQFFGPSRPASRIVVCHLGSGASVTAIVDGRSVDTTMGFTPLEGLIMATRPGDIDPGIITWLLAHGINRSDLDHALEHRCGLAALSGDRSGDMRILLERRDHGDQLASQAIEVYLHRLRAKIAAMTAAAGGLDALVFTGGVGEHAPAIRTETVTGLGWMGITIDEHANRTVNEADAEITGSGGPVRTWVVHAREDLVIAADCRGEHRRFG